MKIACDATRAMAHQVMNATLAAAVGLARGVAFDEIAASLATVQPAPWRMEVVRTADDVVILDDAYNANPSSMAVALEALARVEVRGRRLAVLGEMRELGELSERELLSPRLPDVLARDYARIVPLVRWLNGALGLRPLARR